jgi:DNA polymerase III subunit beta
MQIEVPRAAFAAAFQAVSAIAPPKGPKPILAHVKLVAADGAVTLLATNGETAIRRTVEGVKVLNSGEALLPVGKASSILRELQGADLDIETTTNGVEMIGDRSKFNLSSADPAEFPTVSEFVAAAYFRVPGSVLRGMIRRVVFAADEAATRYALMGALFEVAGETLTITATDTRRLATVAGSIVSVGEIAAAYAVVPAKALSLIERALDGEDYAEIAFTENAVTVRIGATVVWSRLCEGRFPKWQDVIPNPAIRIATIAGALHSAVRQAQIVTSDESRGVDFEFAAGELRLKSSAADVGQSSVQMPIPYEGDPITITFDPRYVADFLKVLPGETDVEFGLTDRETAALLSTTDGYRYVVMPLTRN